MGDLVLALDQGTTSSRAILFDREGTVVATAQREFTQHFPRPGWVEHDPEEIWSSQAEVMTGVLKQVGRTATDLAAIGITNQRETTVVWDRRSGAPVAPAIVWQDRRTAGFCDELKARGLEETVRGKTGLPIDPYFSGTKLTWLLDHGDGLRARAERGELAFGTVDSWLVWKLTGGAGHLTDVSNASRTLLFNIHDLAWDPELLDLLGIPPALLPEVRSSSEVYGETTEEVLGARVPIAGLAGDQQAALFGQACHRAGMIKNTYGTGAFLVLNTGPEPVTSRSRLITTVAWRTPAGTDYALEGSVFIAGAVVQWLRDGLGLIHASSEIEALARSVEDNGGIYLVPAFAGLGAPHWDPFARGTIVGLTRGTTAGHLARAALEAIAFQTMDVLEAMRADSGLGLEELRVDGGAARNDLLMQFQADISGARVIRPQVLETTALGAAGLAGLAVGFWSGPEEIAARWRVDRVFEPAMEAGHVQELRNQWRRAVARSREWATGEEG
jgi:glycerol kinase